LPWQTGLLGLGETAAEIAAFPIYVDARPSLKIQELLATARLFVRRHQVQPIVVDYLPLVDAPGRDLRDRVGDVANALRQLAKSERIGVVLLSQLRRPDGGINAKPSMLDLKESETLKRTATWRFYPTCRLVKTADRFQTSSV